MKTIVLSMTIAVICLVGCRYQSDQRNISSRSKHHPTSAELKMCPYGHATLKDVPIVYGLPNFADKVAMSNMHKAIETFKMWDGGDCVYPDSPTVKVTCVTCGFRYYNSDSECGLWSRSSSEKGSFRHPFSPMLDGFPFPPTKEVVGAIEYSQWLETNSVWMESVSYTSRESQPIVFARTTNWLARFNITTPREQMLNHKTLGGTKRNIYNWGHLSVSVMLHQEEDGTTWVMMSNARR